jgi:competence protein ComGD
MKKSERGFTLLETIFVLSIFLTIASISTILLKPHFHFLEKQQFMTHFKADLLYGQQYAISRQVRVNVYIFPERNYYYLREANSGEQILGREIPERITLRKGTMPLNFQFLPDGNMDRFGSIYMINDKDWYRMTFLIGKGRFYVTKE